MMDLLDGEKILMIYLLVLTQFTNVTDTQTPHDGIGRAYANYAMDTERHATADLVIYRVAHKKKSQALQRCCTGQQQNSNKRK